MNPSVSSLLQCPTCRGTLASHQADFYCVMCDHTYPVVDDRVSFLFLKEKTLHPSHDRPDSFTVSCKNTFKRFPRFYRLLIAIFGASSGGVSPHAFVKRYVKPKDILVNLGSGSGERFGEAIHVDLFAFPGVDIIADISHLPFRSNSIDAVVNLAVLEHVVNPMEVVHEILRVLKPGGYGYFTTPFMQPYHSSPHDYNRWTLDGLRALMHDFEEVHGGLRHGSTSALALLFAHWLAVICSFGLERVYDIFLVGWTMILSPFAHIFDLPLNRLRVSENMASGYFFIVRKPFT